MLCIHMCNTLAAKSESEIVIFLNFFEFLKMDESYNYIDRVCYRVASWLSNNIGCNQVGGLLVKILGLKVSWVSDSLLAIFLFIEN